MIKDRIYSIKTFTRQIFFKKLFPLWQALGLHITPVHFYEPIPDTRNLKNSIWNKHSELVGIKLNLKSQLELLSKFSHLYKKEYSKFPLNETPSPMDYYLNNGGFESVDAEIFYCMLRHFKPSTLFEIGSGNSTLLATGALGENLKLQHKTKYTVFDPYPNKLIKSNFKVTKKKVEEVPLKKFAQLEENDILFIDSSHVIRIGGDVLFEILEVLPRLKKGVIVHFHDIFLPSNYPKGLVLESLYFFSEQYLLQAFLTNNESYEVLFAASFLHLYHPKKLAAAFPSYDKNKTWPGSFWIRKIK